MAIILRNATYLLASIVYFAAISIATRLVTYAFLIQRVLSTPLPDIILENSGRVDVAFQQSEMIIIIMIMTVCLITATSHDPEVGWVNHCIIIATRYLTISSIVLSFRIICICATTLPIPIAEDIIKCHALIALPFVERLTSVYTCGDYMYSGHAAATMVPAYFIIYYMSSYEPHKRWLVGVCTIIASFISLYGIIVSGEHYTIDVIIGAYVGVTMCDAYHRWIV